MAILYAQDAPSWKTKVSVEQSQSEILGILDKLGAEKIAVGYHSIKGQNKVLVIHFEWPKGSNIYRRFEFLRLPVRESDYWNWNREKAEEQARCQCARVAFYMMKHLVTYMATFPQLLTGFIEIPQLGMTEDELPLTLGEVETNPDFRKSLPFRRMDVP